jgi:glycolate oxidase
MSRKNYAPVTATIIKDLQQICGEKHVFFSDDQTLQKYSHDQVPEDKYARKPEVVVLPKSEFEISAIMKLANQENIPVTPRAAGSGLSGGAVPIYGGILLSVERMNKILEIDTANLMAVVEPGVVTNKFDQALKNYGLFFAGYPMSEEFCYIAGNVAENAGGGRAIKYGVTGRYIRGLEVVTPTGDIIQLGGKRIKDVTGYDLVNLMIGSEGTLGIFTKIIIRLLPRPTVRFAILTLFKDVATAIGVVPAIMTIGKLIPTAIEFMDGFSFTKTAESLKETFPYKNIGAALLFEVDGSDFEVVKDEAEKIRDLCQKNNATDVYLAETKTDIDRFWKIRKQIPWVLKRYNPHQSIEDIVVPIANIPSILSELHKIGKKYNTSIPVFGHAGDGNLHATPLKNPAHSMAQWNEIVPELLKEIYVATAALGGTISGEHGIGHKRRDFMGLVVSEVQLEIMQKIKLAFDPNNILNPGKIVRIY